MTVSMRTLNTTKRLMDLVNMTEKYIVNMTEKEKNEYTFMSEYIDISDENPLPMYVIKYRKGILDFIKDNFDIYGVNKMLYCSSDPTENAVIEEIYFFIKDIKRAKIDYIYVLDFNNNRLVNFKNRDIIEDFNDAMTRHTDIDYIVNKCKETAKAIGQESRFTTTETTVSYNRWRVITKYFKERLFDHIDNKYNIISRYGIHNHIIFEDKRGLGDLYLLDLNKLELTRILKVPK